MQARAFAGAVDIEDFYSILEPAIKPDATGTPSTVPVVTYERVRRWTRDLRTCLRRG